VPLTGDRKREYDKQWRQRRRIQYFEDKICAKCGSKVDLELDHIDPSTKISHSIWSWSEERRDSELKKCQVLCYNCHKEKTAIDLSKMFLITDPNRWKHGTNNTYNRHGCRCDLCCAWRVSKYIRLGT
jgi:5-methylcytosine-specific restriction endonuclease McrA